MTKWQMIQTTIDITLHEEMLIPKGTLGIYIKKLDNGKYLIDFPEYGVFKELDKKHITEETI